MNNFRFDSPTRNVIQFFSRKNQFFTEILEQLDNFEQLTTKHEKLRLTFVPKTWTFLAQNTIYCTPWTIANAYTKTYSSWLSDLYFSLFTKKTTPWVPNIFRSRVKWSFTGSFRFTYRNFCEKVCIFGKLILAGEFAFMEKANGEFWNYKLFRRNLSTIFLRKFYGFHTLLYNFLIILENIRILKLMSLREMRKYMNDFAKKRFSELQAAK